MEITLGYGSYCRVSTYQEGLESSMDFIEMSSFYHHTYYEDIYDDIDY